MMTGMLVVALGVLSDLLANWLLRTWARHYLTLTLVTKWQLRERTPLRIECMTACGEKGKGWLLRTQRLYRMKVALGVYGSIWKAMGLGITAMPGSFRNLGTLKLLFGRNGPSMTVPVALKKNGVTATLRLSRRVSVQVLVATAWLWSSLHRLG